MSKSVSSHVSTYMLHQFSFVIKFIVTFLTLSSITIHKLAKVDLKAFERILKNFNSPEPSEFRFESCFLHICFCTLSTGSGFVQTQVAITQELPNHFKIYFESCFLHRCFVTLSTGYGFVFTQGAISWELPNQVKIRIEPSFCFHASFIFFCN